MPAEEPPEPCRRGTCEKEDCGGLVRVEDDRPKTIPAVTCHSDRPESLRGRCLASRAPCLGHRHLRSLWSLRLVRRGRQAASLALTKGVRWYAHPASPHEPERY